MTVVSVLIPSVERLKIGLSVVAAETAVGVIVAVSSIGVEDVASFIFTSVDSVSAATAISVEGLDVFITTSSSTKAAGFYSNSRFGCVHGVYRLCVVSLLIVDCYSISCIRKGRLVARVSIALVGARDRLLICNIIVCYQNN